MLIDESENLHPGPHPATLPIQALLAECDVRRTRRSGPGGQHRNKVETAIVITHRPSDTKAEASERRSLEENRQRAIFRLRVNLALVLRHKPATKRPPSALWQSRCRGGKVFINPEHDDFPALLAEALDAIPAFRMEIPAAAEWLGVSSSQLVKFLKQEPRAIDIVNVVRECLGLHSLK
jgi:hypothetical protein